MQPRDFDEFVTLLNATAELLTPGRPLSPIAIRMWWSILQPYELDGVRHALDRHMRNPDTGHFMPKPADVIRMMSGSTQDTALLAWSKVDRAVRQVGTYQTVVFDDAIIHRVLHDMGGWIALGTKTEDEWPFVAKEFENRYRGYRLHGEIPDYPRELVGISQASNNLEGHESQPPVLIGDSAAAQRVRAGGSSAPLVGFERMSADDSSRRLAFQQEAA